MQVGVGYSAGLKWREIDTAFERIIIGAVINFKHIEPRQFLEDARKIVLERMRIVLTKYDNIKINTIFDGEFVKNAPIKVSPRETTNSFARPICKTGTNRALSSL